MRVAAIYDIHANFLRLRAVLQDIRQHKQTTEWSGAMCYRDPCRVKASRVCRNSTFQCNSSRVTAAA